MLNASRNGSVVDRATASRSKLGKRTKRKRQYLLESLESRVVLSYTFSYVSPVASAIGTTGSDALTIAPIGGFLNWSVNGSVFNPSWGGLMVPATTATTVDVSLETGDGASFQLGASTAGEAASNSNALFVVDVPVVNTMDTAVIDDIDGSVAGATYTVNTGFLGGPTFPITGPGIDYTEPVGLFNGGITVQGSNTDDDTYNVLSTYPATAALGSAEPINIDAGASIGNVINLGNNPGTPASSTLSDIESLVTVSDFPGLATLNLLDAGDTASGDADIEPTTVTGLGFGSGGSVSYAGGVVGGIIDLNVYGGTDGGSGVTYNVSGTSAVTTLYGGPNDNTVNVLATGADAPLNIYGGGGQDAVFVGDAGSLLGILGDVFVDNIPSPPGFTDLTVDASTDAVSHGFGLSSSGADSTLVDLAPATITYDTAALSSLTINTSDFGTQFMSIDMAGGNPIPTVDTPGLTWNASPDGTGGFDTHGLNIFDELPSGPFASETHNANDQTVFPQVGQYGSIYFTDSLGTDTSLFYTGLSPITDTTPAIDYTFNDDGYPDQSFSATSSTVTDPSGTFDAIEFASTPTPPFPTNFETTDIANKNFVTFNTPPSIPPIPNNGVIGTVNVPVPSDGLLSLTFNTFTGGEDTVSFLNTPPGVVTSYFDGAGDATTGVTGLGVADGTVLFLNGGPGINTLNYDAGGEDPTITPGLLPGEVLITIPGAGVVDVINYQAIDIFDVSPVVITPGPAVAINTVEGFQNVDAIVATFTAPIPIFPGPPGFPAGDFTASLDWGDPSPDPDAGTITQDASAPSVYYVTGTHTFLEDGVYTVANTVAFAGGTYSAPVNGVPVSITFGPAGPTPGTDAVALVTQGPLAVSAFPIVGTEGIAIPAGPIATFIDAGGVDTMLDYSATITVTNSAGVVEFTGPAASITQNGNAAQFTVNAPSFTLPEEGTYQVLVAVTDSGGATPITVDGASTAVIADAPLAAGAAIVLAANTGVVLPSTTVVGTFTDANPTAPISDFTDTIDWGDGSPDSIGIITQPGGVGTPFDVTGGHTYAKFGSYSITIVVKDVGGSTVTLTGAAGSATVTVSDLAVTGSTKSFTAVEGQNTGPFVLATFEDPNTLATLSSLNATLAIGGWGDGTPTVAGVGLTIQQTGVDPATGDPIFEVLGSHTYAEETAPGLPDPLSVIITTVGGATTTLTSPPGGGVTVLDAKLTGSAGTEITGVEGSSTGTVLLGTFVDDNQAATSADYTAGGGSVVVNWGDGSAPQTLAASNLTSIGTPDGVEWTINAAHTYTEEGTYSYTVTVTDDGGASTIVSGSAIIADAVLTAGAATLLTPSTGVALPSTTVVATFTDANTFATIADYTTTIDWGDGSPQSTGVVVATATPGVFDVEGGHTYAKPGVYVTLVTVHDDGGSQVVITGSATVTDLPLVAGPTITFKAVEGEDTGLIRLGTFVDPNTLATVADVQASLPVNGWGDTLPTTGGTVILTVQEIGVTPLTSATDPGAPIFEILGSHTYIEEGTYTLTIDVTTLGDTNPPLVITATADVVDAPLTSSNGTEITGVEGNATPATTLLGSFTDANPFATTADFLPLPMPTGNGGSITVNWGDGSAPQALGAANITANGSPNGVVFTITASHDYNEEGTYAYSVTVNDDGGATTTFIGSAFVADAALTPLPPAMQPVVNTVEASIFPVPVFAPPLFNGPVASFGDGDPTSTIADFSAVIDWGDGTPLTAGTVSEPGGVGTAYIVSGAHTYADSGDTTGTGNVGLYPIQVFVVDDGGSRLTIDNTANVADNSIVLTGQLNPASDSGLSTGTVDTTNVTQPNFTGKSEPLSTVTLSATLLPDGTPFIIGQVEAGSDGSWSITSDIALADGNYEITATAIDQFGETTVTNPASPVVITSSLLIDTVGPVVDGMFFNRLNGQVDYIIKDPVNPDGSAPAGVWVNTLLDSSNYLLTKVHGNKAYPGKWIVTDVTAVPDPTIPFAYDVAVTFNGGAILKGGFYLFTIRDSSNGNSSVQDLAENHLDGVFYGSFPSGNGINGSDFVAELQAYHNKVFAPQTIIGTAFAGNAGIGGPPVAPVHSGIWVTAIPVGGSPIFSTSTSPSNGADPPAAHAAKKVKSHVAVKPVVKAKPAIKVVSHTAANIRVHDEAMKALVAQTKPGRLHK